MANDDRRSQLHESGESLTEPLITLVSLGGTIAMEAGDAGAGVTPRIDAAGLLRTIGGAPAARIRTLAFRRVASAALSFADLGGLAALIEAEIAAGATGIIVTQGTDTIEETSFALDLTIARGAPVIVTGAMRHPGLPGADGPANLAAAIRVAADPICRDLGVLVVMNDEIHAARFARKARTGNPAAFVSPACGPLGWVEEGRVRLLTRPAVPGPRLPPFGPAVPEVAILPMPFDGGDALLDALADPVIAGVVVAGMGGGHVSPRIAARLKALAATRPVVLASRTGAGEIFRGTYGFEGGEIDLIAGGLIPAGWLDPLKARILLVGLLAARRSRDEIATAFDWR
jgi:L-asparaginase